MANWNQVLDELNKKGSNYDVVRRTYLKKLANVTGRNVVTYYSGWLQKNKPGLNLQDELIINDSDKNGFMTALNGLDTSKGLDLILHTPGGDTAATESIIDYLKAKFSDIRAIIPQLAMSAGTMISCSCNEIIMGKHSSLGPIDPQYGGLPAHAIIEEFNKAYEDIKADQSKANVWAPILHKYQPTLIGECQKVIDWSEEIVRNNLADRMFASMTNQTQKTAKIEKIIKELGDHSVNLSHSRHLSAKKCKEVGLKIIDLEDNQQLQDAVLSVHHSYIHTLTSTGAFKIIENHKGIAFVQSAQQVLITKP